MLSGWWAALYVGYVAKIGMSAALPLCLIVLAGTLTSVNVLTFSQRGNQPLFDVVSLILQCGILISPLLVNVVVVAIAKRTTQSKPPPGR